MATNSKISIINDIKKYSLITKNEYELDFIKQTIDFLQNNDNYLYRTNLKWHLTNSAWITDKTYSYVLLIHHKKLDKWLQPWWHCEIVDNSLQDWAWREAREETWLNHFILKDNWIFDIDVHPIPAKWEEPEHFHYDIRFWLVWDISWLENIDKNEIINAKWFSIQELEKMELTPSIKRMLNKTISKKVDNI